jgi:hypothetical protein
MKMLALIGLVTCAPPILTAQSAGPGRAALQRAAESIT